MAINGPEEGTGSDVGPLHPFLNGPYRAGLCRPKRNADFPALRLGIGFRTPKQDDQTFALEIEILAIEGDEFGAAECAPQTEQQKGAIAAAQQILRSGFDEELEIFGEHRHFDGGRGSVCTADTGEDATDHRTAGGRFESGKVVIYFTQVSSFSPYRLGSDPLLPRHI
ncbi:MAG: hypothetical protein M3Z85_23055 [Acidobacteriota bacterium]|nr:hypothetical protein [Acidobacteriota bacterium]